MANSSPRRVGVIKAMQFVAAMAIVLWPAAGWGRSDPQVEFIAATERKLEARPAPAKATQEADSALTSKGYVQIGTIQGYLRERKGNSDAVMRLASSIMEKAAEAGGDIVRLTPVPDEEAQEIVAGWKGAARTGYFVFLRGTVWRYDPKPAAKDTANAGASLESLEKLAVQGLAKEERKQADEAIADMRAIATALASDAPSPQPDTTEAPPKAEEATRKAPEPPPQAEGAPPAAPEADEATRRAVAAQLEASLAGGADVNGRDEKGSTRLHYAAVFGLKDLAEKLLALGADVNARDPERWTPLNYALNTEVAELLLAHGADVNTRDKGGDTPLHYAAMVSGRKALAEVLLAHGADVNARDNSGETPLHKAAHYKVQDLVELLRRHGGHE